MTYHTSLSLLYKEIALVVAPLFAAFLSVNEFEIKSFITVAAFGLLKLAAKNGERKRKNQNKKTTTQISF